MLLPSSEEAENIHIGYPDDTPLIEPSYAKIAKLGWRVRMACYDKLFEVLGEFKWRISLFLSCFVSIVVP